MYSLYGILMLFGLILTAATYHFELTNSLIITGTVTILCAIWFEGESIVKKLKE